MLALSTTFCIRFNQARIANVSNLNYVNIFLSQTRKQNHARRTCWRYLETRCKANTLMLLTLLDATLITWLPWSQCFHLYTAINTLLLKEQFHHINSSINNRQQSIFIFTLLLPSLEPMFLLYTAISTLLLKEQFHHVNTSINNRQQLIFYFDIDASLLRSAVFIENYTIISAPWEPRVEHSFF